MKRSIYIDAAERIFDGSETFACVAISRLCVRLPDGRYSSHERELFEQIYGINGYENVFSDMTDELFKKDSKKSGRAKRDRWLANRIKSAGISGYQEVRILALLFVHEMLRTRSISLKDL